MMMHNKNRLRTCLLFSGVLFVSSVKANAIPEPPVDHPRVLVRPAGIQKLKNRFNASGMSDIKSLLLSQESAHSSGILSNGKANRAKHRAYEAAAFLYLINGNTTAGNKAKNMVLDYFRTLTDEDDRAVHRSILGAAFVYDWCYPLFSSSQRQQLINDVIRVAKTTEYNWPIDNNANYLLNHFGEEKIPDMLAFGIACHNENASIYDEAAHHLFNGLVPSRNWFYPSHRHHQGAAYGPGRFESEIYSTVLITGMGAPRPYIDDQAKVLYHTLYSRRPDGKILPEGDDFNYELITPPYLNIFGVFMTAGEFQDPYMQDEALRYESFITGWNNGYINDAVIRILFKDETLAKKPVSSLPLTKFFPSPIASMTARTGWDVGGGAGSKVAIATMKIGEYLFHNHDHLDAGHFSIYYKGPLAIDAGAYANSVEGVKYGGGSSHHNNYFMRSVAHNTLLIHDPNEPFNPGTTWDGINEGGQKSKGYPKSAADLVKIGKQAKLAAHDFGPDSVTPEYSYMKGDMANAYTYSGRPPKAPEVKRSFVFLNLLNSDHPAAVIVFDKVRSAQAAFKKRWLLHSDQEPVITGNTQEIKETSGAYNGKLVNHTLLPEPGNTSIAKVGGTGKEFWTGMSGVNHNWALQNYSDVDKFEAGHWRIEISPKENALTDRFLNVLQVLDADGGPSPLPVEKIDDDKVVGATIADRVVLFSKSGEKMDEPIRFTVEGSHDLFKILVTDIKQGLWDVTGPVNHNGLTATDEGGNVYFQGPAGTYTLKRGVSGLLIPSLNYYTTDSFTGEIRIYSLQGKLVKIIGVGEIKSRDFNKKVNPDIHPFRSLSKGVYFITTRNGKRHNARKVILKN